MNADPGVMEHFPAFPDRAGSEAMVWRIEAHFAERDFGLWALEAPGVASFIGFAGLAVPRLDAHVTPGVEIGWRRAHENWGMVCAREAASHVLAHAHGTLGLAEIVSFTVSGNLRSHRVMEEIGMRREAGDALDHPLLAEGDPL
jgi:ribosomal-protein-alanine N-acetyltransferase